MLACLTLPRCITSAKTPIKFPSHAQTALWEKESLEWIKWLLAPSNGHYYLKPENNKWWEDTRSKNVLRVWYTFTGPFIRYTWLVLNWTPFCLQNCVNSSWHRFIKVLEAFIRGAQLALMDPTLDKKKYPPHHYTATSSLNWTTTQTRSMVSYRLHQILNVPSECQSINGDLSDKATVSKFLLSYFSEPVWTIPSVSVLSWQEWREWGTLMVQTSVLTSRPCLNALDFCYMCRLIRYSLNIIYNSIFASSFGIKTFVSSVPELVRF